MLRQKLINLAHSMNKISHFSIRSYSVLPKANREVLTAGDITVTGNVNHIFHTESGAIFYVKSACPGNFTKSHKVFVGNRRIKFYEMIKKNLAIDQKVCVEGKLNSSRILIDAGKHRTKSQIIATEVFIYSSDSAMSTSVANDSEGDSVSQFKTVDENSVELLGTITTGVSGTNFRCFTLASLMDPKTSQNNVNNFAYNRIFVYDKNLFPLLDNVQVKKDRFLVYGEISYRMDINQFGKAVTTSYITAKQLYRVSSTDIA